MNFPEAVFLIGWRLCLWPGNSKFGTERFNPLIAKKQTWKISLLGLLLLGLGLWGLGGVDPYGVSFSAKMAAVSILGGLILLGLALARKEGVLS